LYPLGYLAYALVRGELRGLYPYPFIDVPALGYGTALLNAFGLLLVFTGLGFAMLGLSRFVAGSARS
jgi:hypothetical protein